MHIHLTILIFYLGIYVIKSLDKPKVGIYCRNKDRLMTSDELDEYLLVEVDMNMTLRLDCHFCNEVNDVQPRIWYYQDRNQVEAEKEVLLEMNNNVSINRVYINSEFSLIIRDFELQDAGIYRCRRPQGQEFEKKYNYRLEPVFEVSEFHVIQRGSLSDWEAYRNTNLLPVTIRFSISNMGSLALIRDAGIILEVVSEWTDWGPCERCIDKKGIRESKAQCRLQRRLTNRTVFNWETAQILEFFSTTPMLPCRSRILDENYPVISSTLKKLPDFILEEKCENCKKVKKVKRDKFKYKKTYAVAAGAHMTITCPEANLEDHVVWRRNNKILRLGTGYSFNTKDSEDRISVDTFSTLYFVGISSDEAGNYTCCVNDVKMMEIKVYVMSRTSLLTEVLLRHMTYLGFIILLSSFCYCGGILVICRQSQKYIDIDYETIIEKRKEDKRQRRMQWHRMEQGATDY